MFCPNPGDVTFLTRPGSCLATLFLQEIQDLVHVCSYILSVCKVPPKSSKTLEALRPARSWCQEARGDDRKILLQKATWNPIQVVVLNLILPLSFVHPCALVDCCLPLVEAEPLLPLCHRSACWLQFCSCLLHPLRLFSGCHPPPHPTVVACPAAAHKLLIVWRWWQRCRHHPSATVVTCPLPGGGGGGVFCKWRRGLEFYVW